MKDIELPPLPEPSMFAEYWASDMHAYARAAVEADRAQRVPEGFALVPIEPTPEMLNCGLVPTNEDEKFAADLAAGYRKTIWAAMLASTPAQPAPQPVERKPMTDEIVRLAGVALNEMPHPVTNWQSAAKKVCEAVAAIKEQT